MLAASLCAGLAAANLVRVRRRGSLAGRRCSAAPARRATRRACAVVCCSRSRWSSAGWWWASVRLDALDRSVLGPHVGEAARARVVVTGPARRTRVPAARARPGSAVRRLAVREPSCSSCRSAARRRRAPASSSSPDRATAAGRGRLRRARSCAGTASTSSLAGGRWRDGRPSRRVGGVADRLRAGSRGSIAPGLGGRAPRGRRRDRARRGRGLSDELRDSFRASGLYHLLAVSGQNVASSSAACSARLAARASALARGARRARGDRRLRARSRLAAVGRPRRGRGRRSRRSPGWRRARATAGTSCSLGAAVLLAWNPYSLLEPGFQLSFAAVAAIFVARAAARGVARGLPGPARLAGGVARLGGVRGGDRADPLAPVRRGPALLGAGERAGRAGRRAAARARRSPPRARSRPARGRRRRSRGSNGWLAAYLAGVRAARRRAAVRPGRRRVARFAASLGSDVLARRARPATRRRAWRARPPCARRRGRRRASAGGSRRGPRRRRRTACGSRSSTSARATRAAPGPGGRRARRRGPPEADVAGQLERWASAARGARPHPSRSATTSAARRRCSSSSTSTPCSTRGSRPRARTRRRRSQRPLGARVSGRHRPRGPGVPARRLRLAVLWPDGPGPPGEDPNDHAIVLLARYGEVDVLLTADAESNVTLPLRLPPVEVLKVAHHGSADRASATLLGGSARASRSSRSGAATTTGTRRRRRSRARRAPGLDVYRTDLDGAITVESDGRAHRGPTER